MSLRLKTLQTKVVILSLSGEQVASIPCVTDADVATAKEIMLHYLATLDDTDRYQISVTVYENVVRSFI